MRRRRIHYLPPGRKRPLCKSPGTGVSSDRADTTCPRCLALSQRSAGPRQPIRV